MTKRQQADNYTQPSHFGQRPSLLFKSRSYASHGRQDTLVPIFKGTMAFLHDLPTELIHNILTHLTDKRPHSIRHLHDEPSETLIKSENTSIKNLSLTCRRLRNCSSNTLYTNVKLEFDNVHVPGSIDGFLSFVQHNGLVDRIESVLFYQVACKDADHESKGCGAPHIPFSKQMSTILSEMNPQAVTIMVPPASFEDVVRYDMRSNDDWIYEAPYQILHLTIPKGTVVSKPPVRESQDRSIFTMRPWAHCTVNEGFFVPNKDCSCREYWNKYVPSVLSPNGAVGYMPEALRNALANVTSFDFIAVFPISVEYMSRLCYFLHRMTPNIRQLRLRCTPITANEFLGDVQPMEMYQWTEH